IEADARAIGFRFADDLWVEQVKIATRAPPRREQASFEADALDVEALVRDAADDPEFMRELDNLVARIRDKLPRDMRELLPQGDEALAREARDRLIGEMAEDESGA
ncbi:MAG: DNA repair exonuclease, partial [Methylocystis sp.]